MTVISDTTAITNLYQIGKLQLLKEVFGSVVIPVAVQQELAEIPGQMEFIASLNFIEIKRPADIISVAQFKTQLDEGEAEAIALAVELDADFVIIDEWKGRKVAKQMGLQIIGLVGILTTAKRKGIVSAIKPILLELMDQAGFRLHPSIVADALREVGE